MENNGENKKNVKSGGERADVNSKAGADPVLDEVLDKIQEADSVLVALSNDPTVDEIAAAMGLSMALDAAGKHVTAIYSGKTPNVLEFLKPRERFETGTESLQDFVIALNKDKADHLRYKIDGDFVKVYVTPYKTTISGDDLEFSRGDYNVDLVIALNVPAASELDAALKEHGRIMHDASSINITNGAEGDFGDVQWVDPSASSISEMASKLAFSLDPKLDPGTATALLTGLVAATDRFKNPATTPDAMVLAAKLMGAGADQQLVVQNVQGEVIFNGEDEGGKNVVVPEVDMEVNPEDATKLEINHDDNGDAAGSDAESDAAEVTSDDTEAQENDTVAAIIKSVGVEEDEPSDDAMTNQEDATETEETAAGEPALNTPALEHSATELENQGTETSDEPLIKTGDDENVVGEIAEQAPEPAAEPTLAGGMPAETPVAEDDNTAPSVPGENNTMVAPAIGGDNVMATPAVEEDSAATSPAMPTLGSDVTTDASNLGNEAPTVNEQPATDEAAGEPTANDDPVKAAMAEAMGPIGNNAAGVQDGTASVAGVDVAVGADDTNAYAGGQLADQMLSNLEKEDSSVGSADYGKMIDDALNEPLPGEGGIQVGENGPNGPKLDTQDVDQADVPEGNLMAMAESTDTVSNLGAQMMAGAGAGIEGQQPAMGAGNGMGMAAGTDQNMMGGMGANMVPTPQTSDISEEDALNMIKQGQAESGANMAGLEGGELPKIITGGGMGIGEVPTGMGAGAGSEMNPATAQTPGVGSMEAAGVPDMNFQGGNDGGAAVEQSAMPLPGQEMAPPPIAPMPDFGAMPPTVNTVPTPEPVQAPSVTVQPDMNASASDLATGGAGALPQMPQVGGSGEVNSPISAGAFLVPDSGSSSSDPSAFKIPGIHT